MNPNRTKHVIGIILGAVLLVGAPIIARVLYLSGMQRAYGTLAGSAGLPLAALLRLARSNPRFGSAE